MMYKDEEHIGYDLAGRKIKKTKRKDKLDSFVAMTDDPNSWRKNITDDKEDEEVEITKEEAKLIGRLLEGKVPHADFDPHPPYVDWLEGAKHPISNAPEPKRRFILSKPEREMVNIDPEALIPKLPSRKDLKPYPTTCYLEYKGHTGPVASICTGPSGQHIASGSHDGTVHLWEVETGRCIKIWDLGDPVQHVAWNPLPELPILAVVMGHDVFLLNTGLEKEHRMVSDLLRVETPTSTNDSESVGFSVRWSQYDKYDGIRIKHFKTVSSLEWHRKGNYFSTVMPADIILIFQFMF